MSNVYTQAEYQFELTVSATGILHIVQAHVQPMQADTSTWIDAGLNGTPHSHAQAFQNVVKGFYDNTFTISPVTIQRPRTATSGAYFLASIGAATNGVAGAYSHPNAYQATFNFKTQSNKLSKIVLLDTYLASVSKFRDSNGQGAITALINEMLSGVYAAFSDGYPLIRYLSTSTMINRRLARHYRI